ncbi:hypothetical protein GQX74_005675, partial [Glossina fuscipes]
VFLWKNLICRPKEANNINSILYLISAITSPSFGFNLVFAFQSGDVAWSNDGQYMYCMNGNAVNLVEIVTGLVKRTYGLNANVNTEGDKAFSEEDEDVIYSFALAPRSDYLLTEHRSSLLRLWHLEDGKVGKLWKSQHKGPIVKVAFNPDCRLDMTAENKYKCFK